MKDVKEMLNRRLGLMGVLFFVVVVLAYSMAFANSANLQQWIGEWKRSGAIFYQHGYDS